MSRAKSDPPERKVGFSEGIDDEAVAIAYARLQNFPQFKLIRKIPLSVVLQHKLTSNSRILDFGCGSGHFLIDLHRILKRKKLKPVLFGLDIAQTMLDQCLISFQRNKIAGIELILGNGIKIPVEDEYFDVVYTSLSLHHWENPTRILSEIKRVIRFEGRFILFDFQRNASKIWFNFLTFITKRIVPKALRAANEPLGSLESSYTVDEIKKYILESSWKNAKYEMKQYGPFLLAIFYKQ
jgi:ubiquinone/menaquinone biosynthesis C-methylase UbiE